MYFVNKEPREHVPIEPPMAIICKCLLFNLRASGELDVALLAASTSKTLPSAATTPPGVARTFGFLLKLSRNLFLRLDGGGASP